MIDIVGRVGIGWCLLFILFTQSFLGMWGKRWNKKRTF